MTVKSIITNVFCVVILAPVLAALIAWAAWAMASFESPPDTSPPAAANTTSSVIRPAPHTPVSGRTVYMANCARCHGVDGDGQGTEQLDRPARSFLAGGFSFGNTKQAIRRVVQHGIAGTPMPGYVGILDARQINAVVDYVQRLAPEDTLGPSPAATYQVQDRPIILRGTLPPRGVWDQEAPRGLLVGGIDGLTLAYDGDHVQLRSVRQGDFARRTDWQDRGGTALEPLGRIIHYPGAMPPFHRSGETVHAALQGTMIDGDTATIRYALPGMRIQETAATATFGGIPGYRRWLTVEGAADDLSMTVPLALPARWLGSADSYDWWIGGDDIVGIRGGVAEDISVRLPQAGTVEILVLPAVDHQAARQAGVPLEQPAT